MPKDKWLHLIAGVLVALIGGLLFDPLTGFVLAAIIGAGKEIHDYVRPESNTPELMDFVATVGGGILGASMLLIFY